MSKATIIIKTFLRPWKAYHQVQTIKEHWGGPVIVADDSGPGEYADEQTYKGDKFPEVFKFLRLPFDIGLSAGRNAAVKAAETEFVFIHDDDFFLDEFCPYENAIPYFEKSGLDIMGFCLKNPRYPQKSYFMNTFELRRGYLYRKQGNHGFEKEHLRVDLCFNCFIARREFLLANPWDEEFKLAEHWEYFYRLWLAKAKVGIYTEGHVCHGQLAKSNAKYMRYRNRGMRFLKLGLKKHGLKGYSG